MVAITCVVLAIMPSVEGGITSALAEDVMAQRAIRFDVVLKFLGVLVILYIVKTLAQVIEIFFLTNAIQNAMYDLRSALQNKIRRLPIRYFDTHQYGDILSVITNDVDTLSNALQQSFINIIAGILQVILAVYMMLQINNWMTLIALTLIPLALIITKMIVKRSQKKFDAQQKTLGKLNGTITEMYGGFHEILLFNRQKQAVKEFGEINAQLQKTHFKRNLCLL